MNERELLVDVVRRLNRVGVPYMLTGSMASNYWGTPRMTHDLDFVLQLPSASVPKMLSEFSGDITLHEESIRAAFKPPHQFNALDNRSALKIDFWLLQPIAFEQEMFRRRMSAMVLGEQTWIATKEDVILHKLYWNGITPSDRQLSDAAGIVAVHREALDVAYLKHWAEELRVAAVLEQILTGKIGPKTT